MITKIQNIGFKKYQNNISEVHNSSSVATKNINFNGKLTEVDNEFRTLVFKAIDKLQEITKISQSQGFSINGFNVKCGGELNIPKINPISSISKQAKDGVIFGIRREDSSYNYDNGLEIFFKKPNTLYGQDKKIRLRCFDEWNSRIYKNSLEKFEDGIKENNPDIDDEVIKIAKKYLSEL
ncbi:MAG: hypothetical protein WCY19_05335 [Candidatus Gastranaerophilaceae bacterium]